MKRRNQDLETTAVEFGDGLEATETDPEVPGLARDGISRDQLRAQYEAMIRDGVIYYPVAYRFLRELGRGRQGVVFLGLRQGARGCVTRHAIKVFDPSIYASAERYWTDMGRIAAQISQLHSLHSPNLVDRDIYEENNGIGYTQMEAIDGMDLRRLLSGAHLEKARQRSTDEEWDRFMDVVFRVDGDAIAIQPGVALHIMRQILRGLEILHRRGFVHSDIKPGNLMVGRLGYVKLVDFGRAVRAGEKMQFLLGSPMYMAPETHRRQPSHVQTDLFSVGLVGIEMLSGRPFVDTQGIDEHGLLEYKLQLRDRFEDLLPDDVRQNEQLVGLLRRFIEPDLENRYPSAEAAESEEGLRLVHKQLTQLGKDTQYERELEKYLSKLADHRPEDAA